jgi:acyl-CoA reductase-like NAD-dependent aldehyde dehydrogenase
MRGWRPNACTHRWCSNPATFAFAATPLGVTLIIGAWNEPFMLLFAPLVAAFAGGNTAVLKPSELAVACSAAAARLVPKYFDPRAVAVVEGAIPETTALLAQKWDFIFFTGSRPVGKIVHQAAAKNLTPCVLELGGKNPTVVHSTANLNVAAHRIAYGRYLNSGHICTAPDHVLMARGQGRVCAAPGGDPQFRWR